MQLVIEEVAIRFGMEQHYRLTPATVRTLQPA
jgi:hypothetical protein